MGVDNWVARAGGELIGYGSVAGDGRLVLAAAKPEIAEALLAPATRRARALGLVCLRLGLEGQDPALALVLERNAFALQRETLLMSRPLVGRVPGPEWPDGIAVRTFESADAPAVHGLLEEAYGAWDTDFRSISLGEWVELMTGDSEFDPTVWWLAERAGELAGCALHWSSGWLKDIAVRASERRCGLGAALVVQGLFEFSQRGLHSVGLKVDVGNPTGAQRLYERLGFATERRDAIWARRL